MLNVVNGIKSGISTAFTAIKDKVTEIFNGVKKTISNIWNGIVSTIKGAINGIIGGINGMIRGVVNGLNAVIRLLNKLHFSIPDWVPGLGGKSFGFNIGEVSAPQIPLLAKGGVIKQPTLAMMGEYPGLVAIPKSPRLSPPSRRLWLLQMGMWWMPSCKLPKRSLMPSKKMAV